MSYQASLLSDYGDLHALREVWPSRTTHPNPTRTFSWFEAFWYQMVSYGRVSCAHVTGSNGAPALLPFFADRRPVGGVPVWRIDGVPRSEAFVQAVVAPQALAAAIDELWRVYGPLAFLRCPLQAVGGATANALEEVSEANGWQSVAVPREMCPILRVPPEVESYAELVSSPFRRRVARDLRRLDRAGKVEFRTSCRAEDFAEALRVDGRSWKSDESSDLVSSRHSHVLYRLFAQAAENDGSLRLYFLELEGRVIAFLYAARIGTTAWLLKGSYDRDFASLRPVVMLFTHAIDSLIAEGTEVIDLWGRADRFKMHWATDYVERSDYYVFPNNLAMRGAAYWIRKRHVRPLVLPQRLKRSPRRARGPRR